MACVHAPIDRMHVHVHVHVHVHLLHHWHGMHAVQYAMSAHN